MTLKDIQQLFAYHAWARERLLESLGSLSSEQLTKDLTSSFPGIQATVVHMVGAEDIWLRRLTKQKADHFLTPADLPSFADIKARWTKIGSDFAGLLATLNDKKLDETISFKNSKGADVSQKVWQALQHIVNHASYHRGQIVTMMRQLGATPPNTDLIGFYRLQNR